MKLLKVIVNALDTCFDTREAGTRDDCYREALARLLERRILDRRNYC